MVSLSGLYGYLLWHWILLDYWGRERDSTTPEIVDQNSRPLKDSIFITRPKYSRPLFTKPQYSKPQFTRPEYLKPQFTKPEFSKPAFTRPNFNDLQTYFTTSTDSFPLSLATDFPVVSRTTEEYYYYYEDTSTASSEI